jgi:uracil-DNA glycosylase
MEQSWKHIIEPEFEKTYFQEIKQFLESEMRAWKVIYPEQGNIFAAFETCSLVNLKIVILGQDPYHGAWQAHWLSFSVQEGIRVPPSLKNIYKELKIEYPQYIIPNSGNLEHWAEQWVLLLNSILTVEAWMPASHSKIGWSFFTDTIIQEISNSKVWVIFVLWGNYARSKKTLIDKNKHFILESPHPSPFSAHTWFLGNWHFIKMNQILISQGKDEIKW